MATVSFIESLGDIVSSVVPGSYTKYQFQNLHFPEDLGSEDMNHYLIMNFFTGGVVGTGAAQRFASTPKEHILSVALPMPSATGGGMFPIFRDSHEYSDIKLTNIFNNAIGVSGQTATGIMRRAINPGVQVLYRGTGLRQFDFAFVFAPASEAESIAMENIIARIRAYASPVNRGVLFEAPTEVEVKFYSNGKENLHIPRISRSVISDVEVNYATNGEWSTFINGHPVAAQLMIRMREMEIIDRNDILEKHY